MRARPGQRLPLVPLLRAYTGAGVLRLEELTRLPGLGPRFQAVLEARTHLLSEAFLDQATEADFQGALVRFYEACVRPALHTDTLRRRTGIVRHALGHLLRCRDPLPQKADRCLAVDAPYHVAGLGPVFWSALFQGLAPMSFPAWTPAIEAGLRRLGLASWQQATRPGEVYGAMVRVYAHLRALEPALIPFHLDHFLTLTAAMKGRNIWSGADHLDSLGGGNLAAVIQQERAHVPLRRRLKERGAALQEARREVAAGLAAQDAARVRAALTAVEPFSRSPASPGSGEALLCWVGRLWEAEDPQAVLQDFWRADPIPGAGLWLPAAVLHLHDARRFYPWNETLRRAYATLDEGAQFRESAEVSYHLYNEGVSRLRELHQLHPLEVPGVLAALAVANLPHPEPLQFGGFCADTFQFLKELEQDNCREWMEKQRDRYRFAVREPLVELCRVLAERYVRPVLCREHGWDLETAPQSGGCLTSVCKNDYGRSVPYHSVLWITFHRRGRTKREDVQFFVRLAPEGLSFGFRLGRQALEPGRLFRRHVQEHGDLLYGALSAGGAVDECRFGDADHPAEALSLSGPEDLRTWAAGKSLMAARFVPANDPLLTSEDLPGAIVLTWDRLLAAYVCAVDPDPLPRLARRAGMAGPDGRYTAADFHRATFLDDGWLARARSLLELKRQLVLQGVPGTGKTHVARCLARWLTGGREDTIRLVQFHPAYSYEEFVEGIKVRSVEVDGRHDVTYPVEDGLLCTFAAEAARNPAEPHVLLIDEINRGNLPRIFGELLYLLEYRDQAVGLPYSKRNFRLPPNLYVIGTMNAADRSVALVDQALRRRFSFLDMPPDAAVLTAWLKIHPPPAEGGFAEQVVALFQRLNARLRADLGATFQVGHSYFMVPALNETRLQVVWEHHIQPLLEEYFHGQPGRIAGYELAELLGGKQRGPGRRSRQAAGALG